MIEANKNKNVDGHVCWNVCTLILLHVFRFVLICFFCVCAFLGFFFFLLLMLLFFFFFKKIK